MARTVISRAARTSGERDALQRGTMAVVSQALRPIRSSPVIADRDMQIFSEFDLKKWSGSSTLEELEGDSEESAAALCTGVPLRHFGAADISLPDIARGVEGVVVLPCESVALLLTLLLPLQGGSPGIGCTSFDSLKFNFCSFILFGQAG